MNRRQLFLSTAKAALATALGSVFPFRGARAQAAASPPGVAPPSNVEITGTPGSPNATTTIDGRVLPPPPQKFGGDIELNASQSKPYWPMRIVPPKGAPNI